MKHFRTLIAITVLPLALACAGGEDDDGSGGGTSGASACDALRDCCNELVEAAREPCVETVNSTQQSVSPADAETWCQATLDSYEQSGACGGGSAGSGGSGGSGGSSGGGGSGGGGTGGSGAASGSGGQGGSGGSSTCAHDECTTGDALDPSCSSCAATVCADDPFCCDNNWNSQCVEGATNLCGLCGGTGGTGGGSSTCAHDECTTGDPLEASCSSCVAEVCADDPYCCDTNWNSFCIEGAQNLCGLCGGGGPCSHDECTTGSALDPSCSSCVATVCADDPYCCSTSWNGFCVDGAKTLCGICN